MSNVIEGDFGDVILEHSDEIFRDETEGDTLVITIKALSDDSVLNLALLEAVSKSVRVSLDTLEQAVKHRLS